METEILHQKCHMDAKRQDVIGYVFRGRYPIQLYVFISWVSFFYWSLLALQQKEIWHKSYCFSRQHWDETMQTGCVWPSCSHSSLPWIILNPCEEMHLCRAHQTHIKQSSEVLIDFMRKSSFSQRVTASVKSRDFCISFSDKERKWIHI